MEARRTSVWRADYEVLAQGSPIATFTRSSWRGGGVLEIGGEALEVRSNAWATSYTLTDRAGTRLASAAHVGHKEWTVEADGTTYQFRRASMWRMEHELVTQGLRMGSVRRAGAWSGNAVADLPGLPTTVALFTLAVVLTTWDIAASTG